MLSKTASQTLKQSNNKTIQGPSWIRFDRMAVCLCLDVVMHREFLQSFADA